MSKHIFKFKQFTIRQEKAGMKVGTDGVLLGAWADCRDAFTILDIGTGTGLIALMLAQRTDGMIDGIEIDTDAFDEACYNVEASDWQQRITLFNTPLQEYARICSKKYDIIVSNPPFFTNSLKTPDAQRTMARHNDSLAPFELFEGVKKLIAPKGSLFIIIPAANYDEFNHLATKHGFTCRKKLWVKPTPDIQPKRVLLEYYHGDCENIEEESLVVEQNGRHQYSDEYKALTKDYYLAF